MTGQMLVSSKELMTQHKAVLRQYAKRMIFQGERLVHHEALDKELRMVEFVAMGSVLRITERELVCLLMKGL